MDMIQLVKNANHTRNVGNIRRRCFKLNEEIGEICRAYLSLTSPSNPRNMVYEDLLEEIVDGMIVCLDIALTDVSEDYSSEKWLRMNFASYPLLDMHCRILTEDHLAYICKKTGELVYDKFDSNTHKHLLFTLLYELAHAAFSFLDQSSVVDIDQQMTAITEMTKKKLDKWSNNRSTMNVETDEI